MVAGSWVEAFEARETARGPDLCHQQLGGPRHDRGDGVRTMSLGNSNVSGRGRRRKPKEEEVVKGPPEKREDEDWGESRKPASQGSCGCE